MTAGPGADDSHPPRANPDLVGQGEAEAVLLRAARDARLPHAWLLTGPRGIGKATLAYRFTRFLLARGGGIESAPGDGQGGLFGAPAPPPQDSLFVPPTDAVFRQVAAGGHPDLFTLERQVNEKTGKLRTEIRVDEVRRASAFLRMTAAAGGWRIIVVDVADELNPNAANALLKVLEEPPRQALLLLVSHVPGRLLPTIRSRCCHLPLQPLGEDAVTALMARSLPELDEPDARALARLADGSIGRALELAESGGLELYRELIGLLEALAPQARDPSADGGTPGRAGRLEVARLHGFADRLARAGKETAFRTASGFFLWWLERLIRAGSLGRLPEEVVPGEAAVMAGLLSRAGLAQWLGLWEKVSRLLAGVEGANLDRKQALLSAFLELEATAGAV